jgi:hypothetical protein
MQIEEAIEILMDWPDTTEGTSQRELAGFILAKELKRIKEHCVTIELNEKEKQVLQRLSKKQDLPEEKIMIMGLRNYQLLIEPREEISKIKIMDV